MKVLTYIHNDFEDNRSSSYKFRESCARFGYEVVNICQTPGKHSGNGKLMMWVKEQVATMGDELTMYADGADTFFLRPIDNAPEDRITYMTETAIWPPPQALPYLGEAWAAHYPEGTPTPWPYLNGGGYIGPASLIHEFMTRYKVGDGNCKNDAFGQEKQAMAFLQAHKDGFPIQLDVHCRLFQSIGHTPLDTFDIENGLIFNRYTKTYPALFHGNGRTSMQWVYNAVQQPVSNG